jgi:hypothetical protein
LTLLSMTATIALAVLQQSASKASIEGVVLKAGTDEPIAQAQVSLVPPLATLMAAGERAGTLVTRVTADDQGRFVIKDIEPGEYHLTASRNSFLTQEYGQGEYRLFFIAPGRYLAVAVIPGESAPDRPGWKPGEVLDPDYFRTHFYPGATVASQATPVDVQAGAGLQGVDFKLTRHQQDFRIRGRILIGKTSELPLNAPYLGDEIGPAVYAQTYDRATGAFEFTLHRRP